MYSDSHFHFEHTTVRDNKDFSVNGAEILTLMAKRNCFFGLDIGTEPDDLLKREACLDTAIANMNDTFLADKVRKFIYFSAGIWPSVEDIKNRFNSMKILKETIAKTEENTEDDSLNRKIIAIGECGLDHHWNPSGVDGRCEDDFNQEMYLAERELFELQLEYAKELNLPVIIHSRDAFEDTFDCIKNCGWDNGIIHCYSYGAEEARKFLDRGWYISFSGSVTYTKKSKMEAMKELLTLVPEDRILCETDSPYLAPVPLRGTLNTPVNVEHTYKFIAQIRGTEPEKLSETVDRNIRTLFNL
ncbi:MAG: TatD family hydrolase [Treponema sp.]|nr:TatD family hydrolase [Treponema sp.]